MPASNVKANMEKHGESYTGEVSKTSTWEIARLGVDGTVALQESG